MSLVQAVLFEKEKFTPIKARSWLKRHNHTPIKRAHLTENYYRYRIMDPDKLMDFITQDLGEGVKLILARSKDGDIVPVDIVQVTETEEKKDENFVVIPPSEPVKKKRRGRKKKTAE